MLVAEHNSPQLISIQASTCSPSLMQLTPEANCKDDEIVLIKRIVTVCVRDARGAIDVPFLPQIVLTQQQTYNIASGRCPDFCTRSDIRVLQASPQHMSACSLIGCSRK
jgi:hypothetical protein